MSTELIPQEPSSPDEEPSAMAWSEYEKRLTDAWEQLLDSNPEEAEVQTFLELHPSLIPGPFGEVGPGGHQGPQFGGVFREPTFKGLARTRRPDFMWVTTATGMITPVCIEIEKPGRLWFNQQGRPTAHLTASLDQLTDWKMWFSEPENQLIFRRNYLSEPMKHRSLEPQYVLIYGRQGEFQAEHSPHRDPGALRKKRDFMRRRDESFYTFDSLRPNPKAANCTTISRTEAEGLQLFALPPTYAPDSYTSDDAAIMRDPNPALARSTWISPERKEYLRERWYYWQRQGDKQNNVDKLVMRPMGAKD